MNGMVLTNKTCKDKIIQFSYHISEEECTMKNIDVEKFVEKFKTDILKLCNQTRSRRLNSAGYGILYRLGLSHDIEIKAPINAEHCQQH